MQGIYYLLSIVAIILVSVWYIRNDSSDGGGRGLLRLKPTTSKVTAIKKRSRRAVFDLDR